MTWISGMRSGLRLLVLASLPVLACDAVLSVVHTSAQPGQTSPWLALGAFGAFVFVCSAVIVVGDAARRVDPRSTLERHPVAVTVVALGGLVGASTLNLWLADTGSLATVWVAAAETTAAGTGLLLLAIMLVRALVGLWRDSELPLWPGRRVGCLALVTAALAAAPVGVPRDGFQPVRVVPALERAWQPVGPNDDPGWTYYDDSDWF